MGKGAWETWAEGGTTSLGSPLLPAFLVVDRFEVPIQSDGCAAPGQIPRRSCLVRVVDPPGDQLPTLLQWKNLPFSSLAPVLTLIEQPFRSRNLGCVRAFGIGGVFPMRTERLEHPCIARQTPNATTPGSHRELALPIPFPSLTRRSAKISEGCAPACAGSFP